MNVEKIMKQFEMNLQEIDNLNVDNLVDEVEKCYNWILENVEASNPDSVRQGYLLVSELGRIVFNITNQKMLKWRDSSRRWLHEDTIKLNAVKELLSSRDESDYYNGIESALNQIVTTENSIVRCFWLSLFYQFNKFKNEDKIKYNIENA